MYKVLIADDDMYICMGMRKIIDWEAYGFEVAGDVSDGIEALEFIKKHKPHVLVADINMPGIDGLELLREIKNEKYNIKTILLTAYKDFNYAKDAIKYNARAYLNKPIDEIELVDLLNSIKEELDDEKNRSKLDHTINLTGSTIAESQFDKDKSGRLVERVLDYINRNSSKDISLKSISQEFFVNPSYLGQLFRKETNSNFNDYLSKVRIEQAQKLIKTTDMKIYEIAQQVGFKDVQYFHKVYKSITGSSPKSLK